MMMRREEKGKDGYNKRGEMKNKKKKRYYFGQISLLQYHNFSGHRGETFLDILLKDRLVTLMPSTQRWSPFNNVTRSPQDS